MPDLSSLIRRGTSSGKKRVYMDHAATTPIDEGVLEAMYLVAINYPGNSASSHKGGEAVAYLIESARESIAESLGALPEELIFTSGATESNNLAILGIANFAETNGIDRREILYSGLEHPSVLEPINHLSKLGFKCRKITVCSSGVVSIDSLSEMISEKTLLVCLQAANNEIGTIQPLTEVATLCKSHAALLFCDATQIYGKVPFDVGTSGSYFASFSSHKAYGPKGIGILWIKGGARNAPIAPIVFGGNQEQGLRSGTLNTEGIVGFGKAAELISANVDQDNRTITKHSSLLTNELKQLSQFGYLSINGEQSKRLPGYFSLTLCEKSATELISSLNEYELSIGSACSSFIEKPSATLLEVGLTESQASNTIRVSLGRTNTYADVKCFADNLSNFLSKTKR